MPAAAPPARILTDFLDVYAIAELQLIRALAASVKKGTATDDQVAAALEGQRLHGRIEGIVRKLMLAVATAGLSMMVDAVTHGGREAIKDLVALLGGKGSDYEAPINRGAIDNLARSLSDRLTPAHLSITRVIDDAYKQVIGRAVVGALTGTQTRWQASQAALDEFAARGITGFTDRSGRRWELSSYAEMAARAATARASVDAHLDRLAGEGFDLVYVSDSPQECPLCRPWEGKVLSVAGTGGPREVTTEHALTLEPVQLDIAGSVEFARAAGFMHPNCTHSLSAYLHGATKVPTATENPQGYEDRQKLRYLERGVRKAKRIQAAAMTPEAKAKADARVRAWQGRIREHVKDTGLIRQPKREQIMAGRPAAAGDLRPERPEAPPVVNRATAERQAPAAIAPAPEPRAIEAPAPAPEPTPEPAVEPAAPSIRKLSDADLDTAMQAALEAEDFDRFDELGAEADRRDEARRAKQERAEARKAAREQAAVDKEQAQAAHLEQLLEQGWDEESAVEAAYGITVERQRRDRAIAELRSQGYRGKSFRELARASYRDHVYQLYLQAEDETNGHMLTRRAQGRGVDPHSLFTGPEATARANASDELKAFWDSYGRPTFDQWQAELLGDVAGAARSRAAGEDFLQ